MGSVTLLSLKLQVDTSAIRQWILVHPCLRTTAHKAEAFLAVITAFRLTSSRERQDLLFGVPTDIALAVGRLEMRRDTYPFS